MARVARAARVPSRARDPSLPSMDFDITTSRPRSRAPGRPGAPDAPSGSGFAHRPDAPFAPGSSGVPARAPADPDISPSDLPLTVRVSNVSPAVDEPTLREFLACCGPLRRLAPAPPRGFVATFATPDAARAALALRHVTLIDRPLRVLPADAPDRLDGAGPASLNPNPKPHRPDRRDDALAAAGVSDVRRDAEAVLADVSAPPAARDAARMDPLQLYRAARDLLPSYFPEGFRRCALFVPVPHLVLAARRAAEARADVAREDEETRRRGDVPDESDVARTVYAGNVNSSITEDMLADFFSIAGAVTHVKYAGSDVNPSRFGFVEFADRAGAEAAKAMGGAQLAEMTLKVKHSNNPIVKEAMKNVWGTEGAARRRALADARREWEDRRRRRRRRRRREEEKRREGERERREEAEEARGRKRTRR